MVPASGLVGNMQRCEVLMWGLGIVEEVRVRVFDGERVKAVVLVDG